MQTVSRLITYNEHSQHNQPQIKVRPGEVFFAETELCTGGWLNSIDDVWTPDKTCASNPTVCVAVEGAKPGDMLAVEILDIVPDKIGYTGFNSESNKLADKIISADWGLNVKTVRIDDEYVHWNEHVKLPVQPMIGTLGTAPKDIVLSNTYGGAHGGNMDVQEVCKGSTVYLPVAVENALLHIGDAHAIQGDGEINGSGGIECRALVKLRLKLMKVPRSFKCVRIENESHIMTVACCSSLEESFYLACEQLIQWMVDEYEFAIQEAYLFLGQVMKSRNTQFVNPTFSYICKVPKKFLVAYRHK